MWLPVTIIAPPPIVCAASASAGVGISPKSVTSSPAACAVAITTPAMRGEDPRRSRPTASRPPVSQVAANPATCAATTSSVSSVTSPRSPLVPNFGFTALPAGMFMEA